MTLGGVLLAAWLVDQWSKRYFFSTLQMEKVGFWYFITPVQNFGAVFGLFPQWAGLILVVGIVFMIIFLLMIRKMAIRSEKVFQIGLGLQLGGALGNISDRIRLGYVRDFIDLHFWPVFNLADVSILAGCVLLFFSLRTKG